ncbi:unnamed protein product [Spodoptera littoralis]|uniref:Uncharacterized protein n=1 Tax=Spodoptera littoralis TaxID=7109 RepID=A0A9P0I549_SPOLI|nr:unnamed protein product [Spodoptera littoralis]CAH1639604.1 unnamed protein product [Spodoptera littoralis]
MVQSLFKAKAICSLKQFQCTNGKCIPSMWVCDLEKDCEDNSDEEIEECKKDMSKGKYHDNQEDLGAEMSWQNVKG